MQYIFIYRAVIDCLSQLLKIESIKAETMITDAAEQQALREEAEAAAQASREEEDREQAAIEEAKKELEREDLARGGSSAQNAKAVVSMSLHERKKMLQESEDRWLENYQFSLAEWNERNQFDAEIYDITSTLTPVQSRLEALRAKGLML